jgi:hypothetical protein
MISGGFGTINPAIDRAKVSWMAKRNGKAEEKQSPVD